MAEEFALTIKRLQELALRAEQRGMAVYSEFLTPAEQELARGLKTNAALTLAGGYAAAERCIACFNAEGEPPLSCLKIAPRQARFADELGHRDFLGSLLGLGIRRELVGDIIVQDNCGYVICLRQIAPFILQQLEQVKRTAVTVTAGAEPPRPELPPESALNVASLRLDALVAAVFRLSRQDAQALFAAGRVFVDSRPCERPDRQLHGGELVSVRGYGRFIFVETDGATRKGRLRARVRIY